MKLSHTSLDGVNADSESWNKNQIHLKRWYISKAAKWCLQLQTVHVENQTHAHLLF